MRLIDADALIEWINEQREQVTKKQVAGTDGSIFTREALVNMQRCIGTFETKINNMPTAYDVDAVVEQLEKKLKNLEHNKKLFEDNQAKYGVSMCVSEITAFKIAIDIVRKGGIDGKEENQA